MGSRHSDPNPVLALLTLGCVIFTKHFTSRSLSFLTWKMGIITVSVSWV